MEGVTHRWGKLGKKGVISFAKHERNRVFNGLKLGFFSEILVDFACWLR